MSAVKMNQKFVTINSFIRDKETQVVRQRKEQLIEQLAQMQEMAQFEHLPEYQGIQNEDLIISIKSAHFTGFEPFKSQVSFTQDIQELIYNIRRKYPWVTIIEKTLQQADKDVCQIQLYSKKHQVVLANNPQFSTKLILDYIRVFIDKCQVIINIICPNQQAFPIGGQLINIFENCQITLSQKDKLNQTQKSRPAKLLSITLPVINNKVKFGDIPINDYHIEISGKYIKYLKQDVQLGENTLTVSRNDLVMAHIKVVQNNKSVEAQVKVNNIIINHDGDYRFWARSGNEYLIQVSRWDSYPLSQNIFVQGYGEFYHEFELVQKSRTSIRVMVRNIIDGSQLKDVVVSLDGKQMGKTNTEGSLVIGNLELKQMTLNASKKGFLTLPLDIDLKAQTIGDIASINLIPDHFSLMNQFHIIIVKPNQLCNLGFSLSKHNEQIKDQQTNIQKAQIHNFSVHISKIDIFNKANNIYQLNLKDKIKTFKSSCTSLNISSVNDSIMTERRHLQKTAKKQEMKDPLIIYLTYGSDVIISQSISCEEIENKTYAQIDLNTRRVELNGKQVMCCKEQNKQTKKVNSTTQILRIITNQ